MTVCCDCWKSGHSDGDRVFAQRHGAEVEFSVRIRFLVLRIIGMLRLQIHCRVLNGTVLGIMDDAMHSSEYFRVCRRGTDDHSNTK